nr:MAG TPA: Cytochrome oxidase maturation protein cbb3-type [Caudoviricetes sp.]
MEGEHKDFLATELLHELKVESERKDHQLGNLHKILTGVIIGSLCAILMVVGGFIWYLNQYDFESTSTATGVYALVDSEGNVIASDFTPTEIQNIMEVLNNYGNGNQDQETD